MSPCRINESLQDQGCLVGSRIPFRIKDAARRLIEKGGLSWRQADIGFWRLVLGSATDGRFVDFRGAGRGRGALIVKWGCKH